MELGATKSFLVFLTCYSVTVQMTLFSSFHTILPFYLRNILPNLTSNTGHLDNRDLLQYYSNSTINATNRPDNASTVPRRVGSDEWVQGEISRNIGTIIGTGYVLLLVGSLAAGPSIQRFGTKFTSVICAFLNATSALIALFARDVITMCASHGCICAGQITTCVAYYTIYSETSPDQIALTRMIGLYSVMNSVGYIIGYFVTSTAYQFFGHKATFGALLTALLLDFFLRMLLKTKAKVIEIDIDKDKKKPGENIQIQINSEEAPINQEDKKPNPEPSVIRRWLRYLNDGHVCILTIQSCLLYVSNSTFWTTAPNFVANDLRAEQWQLGLIMGLACVFDVIITSIFSLIVKTHRHRWMTLLMSFLANAVGFSIYPFCSNIWWTIAPEVIIRAMKNIACLMIATFYPYVGLCKKRPDESELGHSIFTFGIAIGCITGAYGAGVLVTMVTLRWLYIATAVVMVITSLTVYPLATLKHKSTEEQQVRVTALGAGTFPGSMISLSSIKAQSNSTRFELT